MNMVETLDISQDVESTEPRIVEQPLLRDSVHQALSNYFAQLDGQDVTDLYDMVLQEVEQPLLETLMEYTKGNQSKASRMMGLNRGTLRKKLKRYGLD